MKLPIAIHQKAQSDIVKILKWLRKRSISGSQRWFVSLNHAIQWISDNPHSPPFASEPALAQLRVREKLFKTRMGRTYRMLYTIEVEGVLILRIRGPRQRPINRPKL